MYVISVCTLYSVDEIEVFLTTSTNKQISIVKVNESSYVRIREIIIQSSTDSSLNYNVYKISLVKSR